MHEVFPALNTVKFSFLFKSDHFQSKVIFSVECDRFFVESDCFQNATKMSKSKNNSLFTRFQLKQMCEELERMHPRVYMNISRHLSRAPFGELEEAHTAPYLLNAVAKDLFKSGINWAKIVSIFTVSGGLAVDIVRQGHYDYLPRLIESTGDIVEDDLLQWLLDNGGWSGLLDHIRPTYYYFDRQFTPSQWLTIATSALFVFYIISFIVRSILSSWYLIASVNCTFFKYNTFFFLFVSDAHFRRQHVLFIKYR